MAPICLFTLLFAVVATNAVQISRLFDQSAHDDVLASPFQVQLTQSEKYGNVRAIVTHNGTQPSLYPLDSNYFITKVQVYDSYDRPVDTLKPQIHSYYPDESTKFERMTEGTTMNLDIDILENFIVEPNEKYYVQVGGFIPYLVEGQSKQRDFESAMFEADIFAFTTPADVPIRYSRNVEVDSAPGIMFNSCSDAEMDAKLGKTIPIALNVAKKAISFVKSEAGRETLQNFFKSNDESTKKVIIDRFTALIKHLETKSGPIKLGCADSKPKDQVAQRDNQLCVQHQGALAFTETMTGKVVICALQNRFAVEFKRCGDNNWTGTLIHELTHARPVYSPNTIDVAYPLQQCKQLTTSRALQNANSYNWLIQSMLQGKSC
jgi:hypothetical protein